MPLVEFRLTKSKSCVIINPDYALTTEDIEKEILKIIKWLGYIIIYQYVLFLGRVKGEIYYLSKGKNFRR